MEQKETQKGNFFHLSQREQSKLVKKAVHDANWSQYKVYYAKEIAELVKNAQESALKSYKEEHEARMVAELHSIANGYKKVSGDNYSGGFQDGLIFAIKLNNPEWCSVIGHNETDEKVLELLNGDKDE